MLSRKPFIALLLLMVCATAGYTQTPTATPAVPIDPITGVLEAFKTHDVVAMGEGDHGNEQGHAFRLALIRDPRFAAAVNESWSNSATVSTRT